MKRNKYIKWALPFVAALMMTGCIPDDLNENPTVSVDMDPNIQMTTTQFYSTVNSDTQHRYFIYPGGFVNQWCNDWASMEYGGRGKKEDSYFAFMWDTYYPLIIREVVDLVERTRDKPQYQNVHAAAKVIKVENFLRLTDYYGDIPYFNAGKAYYTGVFQPEYDKQEDIYNDFFEELKQAVDLFDSSKPALTGDVYFNGDINRWRRYANSLRLRIAMRLIKVAPQKAAEEAKLAVQAGVMQSNADICYVVHDNNISDISSGNGIANRLRGDKSSTFRISTEMISTMEKSKDPRIRFYAGSYLEDETRTEITDQLLAEYGTYTAFTLPAQHFSWSYDKPLTEKTINVGGVPTKVAALLQYMQPSKYLMNSGSPAVRMSYAEVEFLIADALQRGFNLGISGTADEHFQKGLDGAVRQMTLFGAKVDEAALTAFLSANHLKAGTELDQINTQLWVLHILDPFETWSNWRRTGLPVEQMRFHKYHDGNQSDGQTPRRIQYPVSEQTNNPIQWQAAVDRMGGKDSWLNRVWWDKQ